MPNIYKSVIFVQKLLHYCFFLFKFNERIGKHNLFSDVKNYIDNICSRPVIFNLVALLHCLVFINEMIGAQGFLFIIFIAK